MSAGLELGGDRAIFLLRQAFRHKSVLVLATIAAFALSCLIIFNLTPLYKASALLLLPSAPADDPRYGAGRGLQTDPFLIASELDVLASEEVARSVVQRLHLIDNPQFNTTSFLSDALSSLKGAADGTAEGTSTDEEFKIDSVVESYMRSLSTYNDGRSTTAHVSFTSPDPRLAAEIVNAHVAAYINLQTDRRAAAQRRVVNLLQSELDQRQQDLRDAELALQQFRTAEPTPEEAATSRTPAFEASEEARLVAAVNSAQTDISQTAARLENASKVLKSGLLQSASFVANDAKLVSPATAPTRKVFPKTSLFLLVALIASCVCGFAAAVLFDHALNRGNRLRRAVRNLGLDILGAVPLDQAILSSWRLIDVRSREQIRFVREALLKRGNLECPVILVTSALPREGKSSIAVRLARSLAATGRKTLLIDADMRLACASAMLGWNEGDGPGLADVLAGNAHFSDAVAFRNEENFHLMPPGGSPGDVDVLASRRMNELADQLRDYFQAIVIDSPPLSAASDAVPMAAISDVVVLTVRANRTSLDCLEKSVALLRGCHAPLAGCVLTGVTGAESDDLSPRDRKRYSPRTMLKGGGIAVEQPPESTQKTAESAAKSEAKPRTGAAA